MIEGMKASSHIRQKIPRACDYRFGSQRTIAAIFGVSQSFEPITTGLPFLIASRHTPTTGPQLLGEHVRIAELPLRGVALLQGPSGVDSGLDLS